MLEMNTTRWPAKLVCGLVGAALLVGCGSMEERRRANRDFDYRDAKLAAAPFKVPSNLTSPTLSSEYLIPLLSDQAAKGAVGPQIDVRPPAQLLNIVPGSRAETGKNDVTMWYTARSAGQAIDNQIWAMLANFLASRAVAVAKLDQGARVLDSDWFVSNSLLKQWNADEDDEFKLRQRYRFSLRNDPARGRAGLNVQLLEHQAFVDDELDTRPLTDLERRRYAVRMLNQVSLYIDSQLKLAKQAPQNTGIPLRLGFDSNGQPAWIAQSAFETTWKRTLDVLPKLNFVVLDSQPALGLIEVSYEEPASGFWSRQGLTPFQLLSGKYRLQLSELEDKTAITMMDDKKKLVNSAVISQIYITLSQAFSSQQTGQ